MRKICFVLLLLLASCSSPQPAASVIESIPTPTLEPSFTPTRTSIPVTATLSPTISPTNSPLACNPHLADYCITNGHFILQRPIYPPENDSVDGTYRYASTANGTRDPHHGVELGKTFGTPVHAAAEGVIVFAGPDDKEAVYSPWRNHYGNLVVVRHADELFTLYAHLSKIDVTAGQAVQAGEQIGEIGQNGAATGSHLHFEVRRGDVQDYSSTLNPELWLVPARLDFGAVSVAVLDEASQFQNARLTLQLYSDSDAIIASYYFDTYDSRMRMGEENAALGDLPAGRYRITLIHNSHLYERWVEVQSGKLTQVVLVVK